MAKQRLNKKQYSMIKDTTAYVTPIFKHGTVLVSINTGDNDYGIDTGVANFPNGIIVGGATPDWVNGSWVYICRALKNLGNGATNITMSYHAYSNINQTVYIHWWALGY